MDGTILNKKLKIEEKLAQLNEIAQKVDDMPTFTSNDRAFLEELPGFPIVDGKKVLTATTESGETSLTYEEQESGVVDYSTTEQATGQKWIDGKDIYAKTFTFDTTASQQTEIDVTACAIGTNIAERINCGPVSNTYYFDNTDFLRTYLKTNNTILTVERGSASVKGAGSITIFYTKAEVTKKRSSNK